MIRLVPALVVLLLAGPAAPASRLTERAPPATYRPTTVGTTLEYQFGPGVHTEVVSAVERADGATTVTIDAVTDGKRTPSNKVEIRAGSSGRPRTAKRKSCRSAC
jgi:hypothetical protein